MVFGGGGGCGGLADAEESDGGGQDVAASVAEADFEVVRFPSEWSPVAGGELTQRNKRVALVPSCHDTESVEGYQWHARQGSRRGHSQR